MSPWRRKNQSSDHGVRRVRNTTILKDKSVSSKNVIGRPRTTYRLSSKECVFSWRSFDASERARATYDLGQWRPRLLVDSILVHPRRPVRDKQPRIWTVTMECKYRSRRIEAYRKFITNNKTDFGHLATEHIQLSTGRVHEHEVAILSNAILR